MSEGTESRAGIGVLDRFAGYVVGRYGIGWRCHTCGRKFSHQGKPRRRFLALLDHVVLDHHRLPMRYSLSTLLLPPCPTYTTSASATTMNIAFADYSFSGDVS